MLSVQEFHSWVEFHKLNPLDDYHRLYRPAALVAATQAGNLAEHLAFLANEKPPTAGFSDADLATMKAFGVTPPRRS